MLQKLNEQLQSEVEDINAKSSKALSEMEFNLKSLEHSYALVAEQNSSIKTEKESFKSSLDLIQNEHSKIVRNLESELCSERIKIKNIISDHEFQISNVTNSFKEEKYALLSRIDEIDRENLKPKKDQVDKLLDLESNIESLKIQVIKKDALVENFKNFSFLIFKELSVCLEITNTNF